jgi:adenosylcobinamide-phosphate synthase
MTFSIEPYRFALPETFSLSPDSYVFLIALFAAILSLVLGVLLGPLLSSPRPFWDRLAGGVLGPLARRLDRPNRPSADLALRGFVLSLMVLTTGWYAGFFLDRLGASMGRHFDLSVVALSCLLSTSSVFFVVNRIRKGLEAPGALGRISVAPLLSPAVRIDFSGADDFALVRATLPLCIHGFARGVVFPVFWFVVGGLPAAFAASALGALSWRTGGCAPSGSFALMPMWLDRIAGLIPDLLASLFLALAALFTPTAGFGRALKGLFVRQGTATFCQGGRPLSVAAWALNVSVSGPSRDLSLQPRIAPWVGPVGATARLESRHIRRFLYLSAVAHLIFILGLMGVLYLT